MEIEKGIGEKKKKKKKYFVEVHSKGLFLVTWWMFECKHQDMVIWDHLNFLVSLWAST